MFSGIGLNVEGVMGGLARTGPTFLGCPTVYITPPIKFIVKLESL